MPSDVKNTLAGEEQHTKKGVHLDVNATLSIFIVLMYPKAKIYILEKIAMIISLVGRRVDAHDAIVPRFPLENAKIVRERIRAFFVGHKITALVCSAACGADLLALDVARELDIQRRIILHCEQNRFRAISVVDRPGEWGALFDRIIREVQAEGNLVILGSDGEDEAIFATTNGVMLDEALTLARQMPHDKGELSENSVLAVLVWDGQSRGEGDVTANFADEARARRLSVIEIPTR